MKIREKYCESHRSWLLLLPRELGDYLKGHPREAVTLTDSLQQAARRRRMLVSLEILFAVDIYDDEAGLERAQNLADEVLEPEIVKFMAEKEIEPKSDLDCWLRVKTLQILQAGPVLYSKLESRLEKDCQQSGLKWNYSHFVIGVCLLISWGFVEHEEAGDPYRLTESFLHS